MAEAYHNFEQENPHRIRTLGPIKARARGFARGRVLGSVKGGARGVAHELENAEAKGAKSGSSAMTAKEMARDFADVALKINSLPDYDVKEYYKTIVAMLRPTQTYYEYFSNRKKLRILHDANPALDDEPSIITRAFPKYYNAFFSTNKTIPRVAVNQDLDFARLDGNLIFGIDLVEDRIYACDSKDGYAIWAADLNSWRQLILLP